MNIVEYTQEDNQFYPTPENIADKMLACVDWYVVNTILEPSAGKGDLVMAITKRTRRLSRYSHNYYPDIDVIEQDKYLRSILLSEFGKDSAALADLYRKKREFDHLAYSYLTEEQKAREKALEKEIEIRKQEIHLVGDDFLNFSTSKKYDLIVMNPPFADGDRHLLKAIELQERFGGQVICILNAETITNPYSNTRKVLKNTLLKYGAEVEFINDAFAQAERKADVDIAMVKVTVPAAVKTSFMFDELKKAKEIEMKEREERGIVSTDPLQNMVDMFNFEVTGAIKMFQEFDSFSKNIGCTEIGITLYKEGRHISFTVNEYLQQVRRKYWEKFFNNPQFVGALTSNLQKKFRSMVDKLVDYDFSMHNIQTIMRQMESEMVQGVEDTIMALFDKLSEQHSWYPETQNNIHYFNGWATNKAHKINKKVILPTHGNFSDYHWNQDGRTFSETGVYDNLVDIEKVFNYLDDGETQPIDLRETIRQANEAGQTKNIDTKYFTFTIYKKGTTHIKFKNQALLDKFNIYGSQRKKWLPPNYGKATYQEMTDEEKAVVDDFQGEAAYNEVLRNKDYYLPAVGSGSKLLQLT